MDIPSVLSVESTSDEWVPRAPSRWSPRSKPANLDPTVDASASKAFAAMEPVLTLELTQTTVLNGGIWLHAVHDDIALTGSSSGQDRVGDGVGGFVFSVERSVPGTGWRYILVSRFDPETLDGTTTLKWDIAAEVGDAESVEYDVIYDGSRHTGYYTDFSDHWHIYAYNRHWIAFAIHDDANLAGDAQADSSGVMLIDFLVTSAGAVTRRRLNTVKKLLSDDDYFTDGTGTLQLVTPTNDLFLVEDAQVGGSANGEAVPGVTVGVMKTDTGDHIQGTRLFRVDQDGQVAESVDLGDRLGTGYAHVNGASAQQDGAGFKVLAPQSMNPSVAGTVLLLSTDENWRHVDDEEALDPTEYEGLYGAVCISMATQVHLGYNWWATAYKVRPLSSTDAADYGEIWLDVHQGRTVQTYLTRTQIDTSGNRPHLCFAEDWLILCWDDRESGANVAIWRVRFRIS